MFTRMWVKADGVAGAGVCGVCGRMNDEAAAPMGSTKLLLRRLRTKAKADAVSRRPARAAATASRLDVPSLWGTCFTWREAG